MSSDARSGVPSVTGERHEAAPGHRRTHPGGSRRQPPCAAQTCTSPERLSPSSARTSTSTGQPTMKGRTWRGHRVEGLLPNSRMVQGLFDDLNPDTEPRWAYPDTKAWDAERNTREFIAAMAEWRRHGLLAFTLNLQGGSPEGYSQGQPWHNSAFTADGSLRPDFAARLTRILDEADRLGHGRHPGPVLLRPGPAPARRGRRRTAVDTAVTWVLTKGYRNVLVEIDNECDVESYDHDILKPARVSELIERAKRIDGRRPAAARQHQFHGATGSRGPTSSRRPTSSCCTATASAIRTGSPRWSTRRQGVRRLHAEAHRLQRGRPLRVRHAAQQLHRGDRRARVVGILRLPARRRRVRRGLPEHARQLGHLVRPQARRSSTSSRRCRAPQPAAAGTGPLRGSAQPDGRPAVPDGARRAPADPLEDGAHHGLRRARRRRHAQHRRDRGGHRRRA